MPQRQRQRAPLTLRWRNPDQPLPVRVIRATRMRAAPVWHELHSHAHARPAGGRPFDFSAAIQRLVMDIAIRSPDFRHLDVPRILVSATLTGQPVAPQKPAVLFEGLGAVEHRVSTQNAEAQKTDAHLLPPD